MYEGTSYNICALIKRVILENKEVKKFASCQNMEHFMIGYLPVVLL